jgi:Histidine kinase-, DNA gyrase B-, and HSP90-like ATPase
MIVFFRKVNENQQRDCILQKTLTQQNFDMDANLRNAINMFHKNSSFEMVFKEAVANSIDAGATEIKIAISCKSESDVNSLSIKIEDDGSGFSNKNYDKFSKLFDSESADHKGMGRLVFLKYFNKVEINSDFDERNRQFIFDLNFQKINNQTLNETQNGNRTILTFSGYVKKRLGNHKFINPEHLKNSILTYFNPLLYNLKINGKSLKITITTSKSDDAVTLTKELTLDELPELIEHEFPNDMISLTDEIMLLYHISSGHNETNTSANIIIDNRTYSLDIINKANIPESYNALFMLKSDFFRGKTTNDRLEIDLDESILKSIKIAYKGEINTILLENIESISTMNTKVNSDVDKQYPHLNGYFNNNTVGLINKSEIIKEAQDKFFLDQKEILEADHLDDEKYEKSLTVSSRLLMEYILYRQKIIDKLIEIKDTEKEPIIHELIVPRFNTFSDKNKMNDLYYNNAWLLDDKYMSYKKILSEKEMSELLKEITDSTIDDTGRPDIAIIFSDEPKNNMVDVVIVELKRSGLKLASKEEVVSQLRQRARKLGNHYDNKIQRVWYYGIVDFNDDFKTSLEENKYFPLYSKGNLYYGESTVILQRKPKIEIPFSAFILDYDALVEDAKTRNSTFLEVLKNGFKQAT